MKSIIAFSLICIFSERGLPQALLSTVQLNTSHVSRLVTSHPVARQASSPNKPERAEVELVILRSTGFHPSQIQRKKGHFLLAIQNRTRMPEVNLNLQVEKGQTLKNIKIRSTNRNWSNGFDLHPGIYVLTESSHPSWSLKLTIEAQ